MSCALERPEARVAHALAQRFGLAFTEASLAVAVEDLLAAGARHGAASLEEVLGRIRTVREDDPFRLAVLEAVRVPETYFFRHPEQLQALRALLPSPRPGAPIRAWSAGCASGEEAYSLYFLLREWFPSAAPAVRGTDLSPSALEIARRGRYRERSVRGDADGMAARWLRRAGAFWEVGEEARAAVGFASLDLTGHAFPSTGNGTALLDLALCRNVLIYFSPQVQRAVVERLARCVRPGGILALSPAESALLGGVEGLVPCGPGAARRLEASAVAVPAPARGAPWTAEAPARPAPPAAGPRPAAAPRPRDGADALGPLREGGRALEGGDLEAAVGHLRRALFFDPSLAGAEVWLAMAQQKKGALAEALLHFRSALALLAQLPLHAPVAGTDRTVAWMLQRVRDGLRALAPSGEEATHG